MMSKTPVFVFADARGGHRLYRPGDEVPAEFAAARPDLVVEKGQPVVLAAVPATVPPPAKERE